MPSPPDQQVIRKGLFFVNASKADDEGEYVCKGTTHDGNNLEKVITLKLQRKVLFTWPFWRPLGAGAGSVWDKRA